MLENVIKKLFPIRDEEDRPCTFPTFASQVFFDDGSVLEGKQFGGGTATVDPLTIYPVGSIYMTTKNEEADRPAYRFGGTWEQIKGRMLIGTGAPENNDDGTSPGDYDYNAGDKGGSITQSLTDPAQNAKHKHDQIRVSDYYKLKYESTGESTSGSSAKILAIAVGSDGGIYTNNSGSGAPFDILNPYFAVNIWQRIT